MPALRLHTSTHSRAQSRRDAALPLLASALLLVLAFAASANEPAAAPPRPAAATAPAKPAAAKPAPTAPAAPQTAAQAIGQQVREAVAAGIDPNRQVTIMVDGKEKRVVPTTGPTAPPPRAPAVSSAPLPPLRVPPGVIPNPAAVRQEALRARAAIAAATAESHGGEVHWSYEGAAGPQNWGRLKPEFNVCAIGRRQSPINIEEATTLRGPAEPIQFAYAPSSGSVVNNGHTVQVDVVGENTLTVRDTPFKLVQFHFHHPSEERVNHRSFAMVAHLVHRSADGQLAVLAVLLDPGEANNLIHKVWTHMPLDSGDRVRMPAGSLNLNELLPQDQRYYQFIGSLTTPPCTEGVLWLVLKQPVAISRDQLRLFSQLFPNNARPVQPVNGRPVREAQ
jgi:carbonic anhydrase